jgi:hypothetical protein
MSGEARHNTGRGIANNTGYSLMPWLVRITLCLLQRLMNFNIPSSIDKQLHFTLGLVKTKRLMSGSGPAHEEYLET